MSDEKFDEALRGALQWEADEQIKRHSPQRLVYRRIAVKLGSGVVDAKSNRVQTVATFLRGRQLARSATNLVAIAAVLVVAALVGVFLVAPGNRFGAATGPQFVSERHGYSQRLPDASWQVTEVPGEWQLGTFLDALSPGEDSFERVPNDPPQVLVYVWISSQPMPEGMSFDGWLYVQDGVTRAAQPCFVLQGDYAYITLAGETARVGAYRCPNFQDSGVAWSTVQVHFSHEGRGYAAYFWPEQEPEAPPLDDLRTEALRWLSNFSFIEAGESP